MGRLQGGLRMPAVHDFQKERMLKDPKERAKLQEEIEARQKEIGVRGMVGLRGQNEFQILEDLKNNSSKIEDTMLQSEENRQRREKPKKEEKPKEEAAAPAAGQKTQAPL